MNNYVKFLVLVAFGSLIAYTYLNGTIHEIRKLFLNNGNSDKVSRGLLNGIKSVFKGSKVNDDTFSLEPMKSSVQNGEMSASSFMLHKMMDSLRTIVSPSQDRLDYSYIFNDLMITLNLLAYTDSLMTCGDFNHVGTNPTLVSRTVNSYIYRGVMPASPPRGPDIFLETSMIDVDSLIAAQCGSSQSESEKSSHDRCFIQKNYNLLRRAFIQLQLRHSNVAKLLGVCVAKTRTSLSRLERYKSAGIVVMREFGDSFDIVQAQKWPWPNRIKTVYQLLGLVLFLSDSPLGSVAVSDWKAENFVVNSEDTIKLVSFGDDIVFKEQSCKYKSDCLINTIDAGIECTSGGECNGYNSMSNLFKLSTWLLFDLLHNPKDLNNESIKLHTDLVTGLSSLKMNAKQAHLIAQKLVAFTATASHPAKDSVGLRQNNNNNNVLFDSSYNHKPAVVINDIQEFVEPLKVGKAALVEPLKQEVRFTKHNSLYYFNKLADKDFPGKHDYYCPNSKAEWGCIKSLQTAEEAAEFCLSDVKCKAFVTIPHLRKQGWLIAILKSDSSKPALHPGISLYVKDLNKSLAEKQAEIPIKNDNVLSSHCVTPKQNTRDREASLMLACGKGQLSDEGWIQEMSNSVVQNAKSFQLAHGIHAAGGQMDIEQQVADGSTISMKFSAKSGPLEYSASQLAVYKLDRIFGLFISPPVVERCLTPQELIFAKFPVDMGGNVFDKFKSLKHVDGSLSGVITPAIDLVTIQHYIKVPHLDALTEAVTSFSLGQLDDMEYLILGHLASIPLPTKGHTSWQGRLVFVKTDRAFVEHTGAYIPYFYNCQFPISILSLLKTSMLAAQCDISHEISRTSGLQLPPKIQALFNDNAQKLLNIFDECVSKFGEDKVLIDNEKL